MRARAWLSSSLVRQFPLGRPRGAKELLIPAARGERVSFQASVRVGGRDCVEVSACAFAPAGLSVRVRRVGYVPMAHHNTGTPADELDGVGHVPGFVPDPLFPESTARVGPNEVTTFWLTVGVARDVKPGPRRVRVELRLPGGQSLTLMATVLVSPVVLEKRKDFNVTHWFYADSICDWYGLEPFEKAFWPICERYMRNYAEHGCDVIYVPVFTPPLDGVKRPTQLLRVTRSASGQYAFDWRDVKRWIGLARKCGIRRFEWTHLVTQWGCREAIRVYEKRNGADRLLWAPRTGATSKMYRSFLSQFLPAFERFLRREKLLQASFFHVSDEPGAADVACYRKAREMLRELAPWMKVMDALSHVEFAREGLTDLPVAVVSHALEFVNEGIPCWTYFCCGPRGRYLNRLLDTPLPKVRMSGWLFYRFGVRGFLHWGYNYWYKSQTRQLIDPFTVTDGLAWPGWAYGDTFEVYPGPDGPIDSIRWEVFAESLQDYALLQTVGLEPNAPLLSRFRDFDDFPKDEGWHRAARKKLLLPGAR